MRTATVAVVSVTGNSFEHGNCFNIVCVYAPVLFEKSLYSGGW